MRGNNILILLRLPMKNLAHYFMNKIMHISLILDYQKHFSTVKWKTQIFGN